MKVWQVLLIGGGLIVGAMVLMKMTQPKAKPATTGFGAPSSAINGLAAGIGGFLAGFASKPSGSSSYTVIPNEGTYHADTSGFDITGNTLSDPNTGKTLIYGTD